MKLSSRGLRKALILTLTVVLAAAMAPTAGAEVVVTDPGAEAVVTFSVPEAAAVEGTITFSDPSLIKSVTYKASLTGMKGLVEDPNTGDDVKEGVAFFYADSPSGGSATVKVTVVLSEEAVRGSSLKVRFAYAVTAPGSSTAGAGQSMEHTLTVRTEDASSSSDESSSSSASASNSSAGSASSSQKDSSSKQDGSSQKDSSSSKGSSSKSSSASKSQSMSGQTGGQSAGSTVGTQAAVDVTELMEEIEEARALVKHEYTNESWAPVETALTNAINQLSSRNQTEIHTAAETLEDAMDALVPMDYTALQEALDAAPEMERPNRVKRAWKNYVQALEEAQAQLNSGDQSAVDSAVENLQKRQEALQKKLVQMDNAAKWKPAWNDSTVVLLICIGSVALNLLFVVLIVIQLIVRRRINRDSTPLVEYDIAEDAVEINEDLVDMLE